MNDFDERAKEWDQNQVRNDRAKKVAVAINNKIKLRENMTAFEYGCGTGLLSFQLKEYFDRIVLADNSEGMLEVLKEKIIDQAAKNMEAIFLDLTTDDIPEGKYDVIYTLMTLHHIPDIETVINKIYNMLLEDGYFCIADLTKENGDFHGKDFSGHNGFSKDEIETLLTKQGFNIISYQIVFERTKIIDGKKRIFPVFLVIAQK